MSFGGMPGERMVYVNWKRRNREKMRKIKSEIFNYWPWDIFITQQTKRDTVLQ